MIKYLLYSLLFVLTQLSHAHAKDIVKLSMTKDIANKQLVFNAKENVFFHLSFTSIPILADYPNNELSLLNAIKKNKRLYILLSVYFSSRSAGAINRCSAGEEHYLVWIELDESRHLIKAKEQIYSSCLFSLEINNPNHVYPPITIDALTNNQPLSVIHAFNNNSLIIRYDLTLPENGIKVIER